MRYIHVFYNPKHNSIDINHFGGYILRIDCSRAEEGVSIPHAQEGLLDVLAIDNPLEYVVMYLNGSMQSWIDCVNNGI